MEKNNLDLPHGIRSTLTHMEDKMKYTEEFTRQYECPNYRVVDNASGGGTAIYIFQGMAFLTLIQKRPFEIR